MSQLLQSCLYSIVLIMLSFFSIIITYTTDINNHPFSPQAVFGRYVDTEFFPPFLYPGCFHQFLHEASAALPKQLTYIIGFRTSARNSVAYSRRFHNLLKMKDGLSLDSIIITYIYVYILIWTY